MRQTVIVGNWKMNNGIDESRVLLNGIVGGLDTIESPGVKIVVCPPFTSLFVASEIISGTDVRLGAQNMSEHDSGAFTGEISWKMLKSVGCEYVIIGHSERRQFYSETDDLVNKKVGKAVEAGLLPIFCLGETLQQREKGVTEQVIDKQVRAGLDGLSKDQVEGLVIAYEPVWAIGTGKTATPDQAQDVHRFIRGIVRELYGDDTGRRIVILYGGSVKPGNASDLLSQDDIDGALVGGACLTPDSFLDIARSAPKA